MARPATRSGSEAKKDGAEIPVLPVSEGVVRKNIPQPKIGMIVIYNNTPAHAQNVIIPMPMIITKIHSDGNTVDGVIFNTNSTAGGMGAICIYGAVYGNSMNCWCELDG